MIFYTTQDFLKDVLDSSQIKSIPFNWGISKIFTVTFEGWNKFNSFDEEFGYFNEKTNILCKTLKMIISIYKDKYIFTNPVTYFNIDGKFSLKVAALEIEEYERRIKKENGK